MKRNWGEWTTIRRRVSIGGRVIDVSGAAVSGARVVVQAGPTAFDAMLANAALRARASWDDLEERIDRTVSRHDGSYFLLDLPDGKYSVEALASGKRTAEREIVVRHRGDRETLKITDMKLQHQQRN